LILDGQLVFESMYLVRTIFLLNKENGCNNKTRKMLNEIIIQGLIKVFFERNMFVLRQVVDGNKMWLNSFLEINGIIIWTINVLARH